MKKTISIKRRLYSITAILCLGLCFFACSSGNNTKEEVRYLSEKFFKFAQSGELDSMLILYPEMDQRLIAISSDSIKIGEVKVCEDGKFEVPLTNYFSFDNSEKSNVETNISLIFEKSDSIAFGYIISDSKGLVNRESLPQYMTDCGSISPNQKYTDQEYSKRYSIALELVAKRAMEVAKEIENSIEYKEIDYYLGLYPIGAIVQFSLTNNSKFSCDELTVDLSIDYVDRYKENHYDTLKKEYHRGDLSGTYTSVLSGYSTNNYELKFNGDSTPLKGEDKNPYNLLRTCFSLKKITVRPEAVLSNISIFFDGTEYNKYMSEKKEEQKEQQDKVTSPKKEEAQTKSTEKREV